MSPYPQNPDDPQYNDKGDSFVSDYDDEGFDCN